MFELNRKNLVVAYVSGGRISSERRRLLPRVAPKDDSRAKWKYVLFEKQPILFIIYVAGGKGDALRTFENPVMISHVRVIPPARS